MRVAFFIMVLVIMFGAVREGDAVWNEAERLGHALKRQVVHVVEVIVPY